MAERRAPNRMVPPISVLEPDRACVRPRACVRACVRAHGQGRMEEKEKEKEKEKRKGEGEREEGKRGRGVMKQ